MEKTAEASERSWTQFAGYGVGLLALVVGAVLWVMHVHALWDHIVIDDAYITYRYAENLAAGHGALWNPGDAPVEGYTTPLYMLFVAFGSLLNLDTVTYSKVLCSAFAFLMVSGVGVWVFGRTRSVAIAGVTAGLLFAHPYVAVWAVGGMETTLYAALVVAAVLLVERFFSASDTPTSKWVPIGLALVFGALGITRTEGPIFAMAFAIVVAMVPGTRRQGARIVVGAASIVLVQVAIRLGYYGHLLPAPAYLKGREALVGWNYVRETVDAYWPFIALAIASISVAGWKGSKRAPATAFAITSILLLAGVIVNTEPLMTPYHRYLFPMIPLLFGLAGLGLCAMVRVRENRFVLAAFVAFMVLARGEHALGAKYEDTFNAVVHHSDGVRRSHIGTADWIREHVEEGALVAVGDCGLIPYYSHARILDLFGLNDYTIAKAWGDHRLSPEAVEYVFAQDPDYVILTPLSLDDPLEQDPRFRERYQFVTRIDGFYTLGVFSRKETQE